MTARDLKLILLTLGIFVLMGFVFTQDPKPEATKSSPERADTLVSRTGLIQILREQQKAVRENSERLVSQIQGQIDAFEAITEDSVRVKKSTFRGQ